MGRQDQMTVVIDENIGADSRILQEVLTRKWASTARLLHLGDEHTGIPDIEILDKLLGPKTVLVTKDRVLHNRAISAGYPSYTFDEYGQVTKKALAGIRVSNCQPKSHEKVLQSSYVKKPSWLSVALASIATPRELKRYRTRRRRIRSYFGSMSNIQEIALTVGSRRSRGRLLCGYMLRVAGNEVKGLKATEGYAFSSSYRNPAVSPILALVDVFALQLDGVRCEIFIMDSDSLALSRQLVTSRDVRAVPERVLAVMLREVSKLRLSPCTKGRFHDAMQNKFQQLISSRSNEIRVVDMEAICSAVLSAGSQERGIVS